MNPCMKLKRSLILQSFMPLFILLFIKYINCDFFFLTYKFFKGLFTGHFDVFIKALTHEEMMLWVVIAICIIWSVISLIGFLRFNDFQSSGFIDDAERVEVKEKMTDSGIIFFMTFVMPLVLDDLGEPRDFLVFIGMLFLVIVLMWKTNLYYQNPILTILGYKVIKFSFKNTESENLRNKEWIGISRKEIDSKKIIVREYISDDVFMIRNKT